MQATVHEVTQWCGAEQFNVNAGDDNRIVAGVSTDTRHIKPGQLFVPLRGERFDGHDYIQAARNAGAAATLWERGVPLPSDLQEMAVILVADTLVALQELAKGYLQRLGAKVVGVTGSNGKTTTKDLVSAVLSTRYRVHKTEGNLNNHIGLPLTILSSPIGTEVLVLEMGMSEQGEIAFLSVLAQPDVAIITNVGESHLLQLGSRSNIARAKLEIMEGLRPGGSLFYYGDEPLLVNQISVMELTYPAEIKTYGEGMDNDWVVSHIRVTAEATLFTVSSDEGTSNVTFRLPVLGKHNAVNALAAIAVGHLYQLSDEEIASGLQAVQLTGMRIERSLASNGAVLLNDAYNASPTSVKAAIDLVERLSEYKCKWIVLGDMLELGPDEAAFHEEIGAYLAGSKADRVLVYGPLSKYTYEEAKRSFPTDQVQYFEEKSDLINDLLKELAPEDLVLVKASRGMKLEEVIIDLQRGVRG